MPTLVSFFIKAVLPDMLIIFKQKFLEGFEQKTFTIKYLRTKSIYHFTQHITNVANWKSGFDTFFHLLVVLVVQRQHLVQVGKQLLQQLLGHDVGLEEGPIEKTLKDFEVTHVALLHMGKL